MRIERVFLPLVLGFWAFIVFIPFYLVVTMSVKAPSDLQYGPLKWPSSIQLSNYWTAWKQANLGQSFMNSVLITSVSVIMIILFSSMAAYRISRRNDKWSNMLYVYFLAGIMVPFQLAMIPLYKLLNTLHLIGKYSGAIFIYTAMGISFAVFLYVSFFKTVPRELEESAQIDGCGPFRTFWQILFPLIKPITSTVVIINSLFIWNDFFIPMLFLQNKTMRNVPLSLYTFTSEYTNNWVLIFAAVVIGSLPLILLFLSMQKHFIQGIASGAIKG
ncbi:sugar ABC transporter permease [Paenibacillus marchantiophytorum]|uniref:Sugar ABC transporter permease n=1 Tax=Paenibacillus marchantiophytorum TaxID=1619310 RepID=A0ABQ1FKF9_9BACL|nr:carbohydrate ABC transporter permease [Paenibacillus marchantiophytorum]GGA17097.1 sugar ABC transporter permease [Paenibacillus marchantiophytorum]